MRISSLAFALAALVAAPAHLLSAQSAPAGNLLTLADAITLARRNSPSLQSATNARRTAAANVRAATGAFLPNFSTSLDGGYREGRQTVFQGQTFGSSNNQLSTGVGMNASLQLSPSTFAERRQAKANAEATEADITQADQTVRTAVTTQYIAALQAQARAALQDTLLVTTNAQLLLARARLQVGSGTQLEVQRAEVADGQQRVAVINARNQVQIEIVRLFQQMGIEPVIGTTLDNNLPAIPAVDMQALIAQAKRDNPQIDGLRDRERAAAANVSAARSQYVPTLGISAGVSGYTNRYTDVNLLVAQGRSGTVQQQASCIRSEEVRSQLGLTNNLAQCSNIIFTAEQEALIRSGQSKYPFDFTRNPYNISASLSLPLFNGFRREQQVQLANVQRRNAQNDIRAQELRVSADITSQALLLSAAQETVTLQEQNARTARVALQLAQERYRVGAINLVDLVQARGDYETAETNRITALFDAQRAFTALESAVGRPLR